MSFDKDLPLGYQPKRSPHSKRDIDYSNPPQGGSGVPKKTEDSIKK